MKRKPLTRTQLAQRGGRARARKLSAARRAAIARAAATARWARRTVVALALLLACTSRPALAQQTSVRELGHWMAEHTTAVATPPAAWRGWWDEVAAQCGCTPAVAYEALEVYTAPGEHFGLPRRFGSSLAAWLGGGIVVVAEANLANPRVVKHELLHVMLGPSNGAGHPPVFRRLGLDDERL